MDGWMDEKRRKDWRNGQMKELLLFSGSSLVDIPQIKSTQSQVNES